MLFYFALGRFFPSWKTTSHSDAGAADMTITVSILNSHFQPVEQSQLSHPAICAGLSIAAVSNSPPIDGSVDSSSSIVSGRFADELAQVKTWGGAGDGKYWGWSWHMHVPLENLPKGSFVLVEVTRAQTLTEAAAHGRSMPAATTASLKESFQSHSHSSSICNLSTSDDPLCCWGIFPVDPQSVDSGASRCTLHPYPINVDTHDGVAKVVKPSQEGSCGSKDAFGSFLNYDVMLSRREREVTLAAIMQEGLNSDD